MQTRRIHKRERRKEGRKANEKNARDDRKTVGECERILVIGKKRRKQTLDEHE